jgi:hypothetical protein
MPRAWPLLADDELGVGGRNGTGKLEPETPRQSPHRYIAVVDMRAQQAEAGIPCVLDDVGQKRCA